MEAAAVAVAAEDEAHGVEDEAVVVAVAEGLVLVAVEVAGEAIG